MKHLKSILSQELSWTFSKKKITLKSNEETVVVLVKEKYSRASYLLEGENYIIRNEGFWNPQTIIEQNGKQLLVLKRQFLGSKGNIEFRNGNQYSFKIRNSPLIKLSFFSAADKEILYYKLVSGLKPQTVLSIVDYSINERELLMLIILGCYSFEGIVKENDTSDLIIMTAGA